MSFSHRLKPVGANLLNVNPLVKWNGCATPYLRDQHLEKASLVRLVQVHRGKTTNLVPQSMDRPWLLQGRRQHPGAAGL